MTGENRIFDFRTDLQGTCPCGKTFRVDTSRFAVIHDLPMCEQFRTLEPDKYLRYVRVTLTGITDN